MKPEQRQYILENMNAKSIKEIAVHLGMKYRTVKRFTDNWKQRQASFQSKQEFKKKEEASKKKVIWPLLLVIIILGCIVYTGSLKGQFIWDDNLLVKNYVEIRDWKHLPRVMTGNLGGAAVYYEHSSFRPMQTISYMVDYTFWKMNPFGYRLTSMILHIGVGLAVFGFIFVLFNSNLLALLTASLYVVHPIHTEAVSYVAGRADPLSSVFMLLSLICYIKGVEKPKLRWIIPMTLSFICAILSRENALFLPFLALVYHLSFRKRIQWTSFIIMLVTAGTYIILRVTEVLGQMGLQEPVKTSIAQRIPGFFVAMASYMKLLIVPFDLHMEYGRPLFKMSNPQAVIGMLIVMGLVATAVYLRKRNVLISFGIVWFLAGIMPVANIFVVVNAYMAEHWLYLPSIGIFLIMAYALTKAYQFKALRAPMIVVSAGLVIFYSYLTIQQNKTWLNQVAFYERLTRYAPGSGRLFSDLGAAYFEVGRKEDAIKAIKRAIKLRPNYYAAYSNLGTAYANVGKIDEAIKSFKRAIEIRPDYHTALFNLANIYKDTGKVKESIELYERVTQINNEMPNAYNNLAIAYSRTGQKEKAVETYRRAIELSPTNTRYYNNMASAYSDLGKHADALGLYQKALQHNPGGVDKAIIYYNMSLSYFRLGKEQEGLQSFATANTLPVNSVKIYQQLAGIFKNTGRPNESQLLTQKAAAFNSK